MIRSSSISDIINAVRQPEYASLYESLQQVIPHLDNIDALAGEEFDQLIASLEDAKDFSGITVVSGSPAAWDSVTKTLTIPTVKGDKGETGQVGPAGPQGNTGPAGEKGTSLTIVSIIDIGDGKLQYQFNDGTTYTTPDLRGPEGEQGPVGPEAVGVHHVIATNTTEPHGNFGETGEVDTYTLYGDDDQTIVLGSFQVANGIDPYKLAADAGYSGSKESYYLLIASAYTGIEEIVQYAADAEQSKLDAAAALDEFTDLYLGSKDDDPTVDNDGDAIQEGALYKNSVTGKMRIYSAATGLWSDAYTDANEVVQEVIAGTGIVINNDTVGYPIISALPTSSAGLLSRLYATGDTEVIGTDTYYKALPGDAGTASSVELQVVVNDGETDYFAEMFAMPVVLEDTLFYSGTYRGTVSIASNKTGEEIEFGAEIYVAEEDGTVVDSGIASESVGSLGVRTLTVMSTGLLGVPSGREFEAAISAELSEGYTLSAGRRIVFRMYGKKPGTAGGDYTLSLFVGNDRNSYIDVPVAVNTSGVVNKSNVVGATATDAINSLNSRIDSIGTYDEFILAFDAGSL
jgi:hypothetical protein